MAVDRDQLLTFVLRLADDNLVLGHRLSEWCGHAPMLEEDLAMPNMALDLIGQARSLYQYAAEIEGKGRTEDDLAYLRREREYLNCLLVERPNGDFAHTMLRQFWFAAYLHPLWEAMQRSSDETLAGIAGKAVKEVAYHIRHAGEWVVRLGDGTEESAARMKAAVEALSPYLDELFESDEVTEAMAEAGIAPDPASLGPPSIAWSCRSLRKPAGDARDAMAADRRPPGPARRAHGLSARRTAAHAAHLSGGDVVSAPAISPSRGEIAAGTFSNGLAPAHSEGEPRRPMPPRPPCPIPKSPASRSPISASCARSRWSTALPWRG
jgi:ring-1,2-phenylacetyl-CoA epoxidase subunit PaaC